MNLRKTFFILPNLFTLSSVFCGFFAISTVASGATEPQLHQAAIAIIFGLFFDAADGRVARLTKTQSALGLQLDSLADLITFGVAPALMIHRWGLDRLRNNIPHVGQHLGLLVAFVFVACAALRLARFNVLAIAEQGEKKKPGKYILGLPVPVAAAVLVSMVVLNHQLGGSYITIGQAALAAIVLALSYLMVSKVRFRSFKDLRPSRRTFGIAGLIVGVSVVAVSFQRVPSGAVLVTLLVTYLALGVFEEIVLWRARRLEEAAARAPRAIEIEAEGGARSDEEVLEELGAFDDDQRGDAASPPIARPRAAASR
jgi:CDP-diacylglycerol--serine O-phosphatidyltransferase